MALAKELPVAQEGHMMLSAPEPGPRHPECTGLHNQRPVGTPLSFMPKASRKISLVLKAASLYFRQDLFTCLGGGPGKEDIWEPLLAGEKNTHTVNMYKRLGNLAAQDPVENFYSLLLLLLLLETLPPTHPFLLLAGDMS